MGQEISITGNTLLRVCIRRTFYNLSNGIADKVCMSYHNLDAIQYC